MLIIGCDIATAYNVSILVANQFHNVVARPNHIAVDPNQPVIGKISLKWSLILAEIIIATQYLVSRIEHYRVIIHAICPLDIIL